MRKKVKILKKALILKAVNHFFLPPWPMLWNVVELFLFCFLRNKLVLLSLIWIWLCTRFWWWKWLCSFSQPPQFIQCTPEGLPRPSWVSLDGSDIRKTNKTFKTWQNGLKYTLKIQVIFCNKDFVDLKGKHCVSFDLECVSKTKFTLLICAYSVFVTSNKLMWRCTRLNHWCHWQIFILNFILHQSNFCFDTLILLLRHCN